MWLLDGLISIIDLKLPFCDDFLVFAFILSNLFQNNNNKQLNEKADKLLKIFENVVSDCLSSNDNDKNNINENREKDDKNEKDILFKQRNYIWFKPYLQNSNVWLAQNTQKNESSQNSILFDKGLEIVDETLIKQKQFIWDNIKTEKKENSNKLCEFGMENENKTSELELIEVRQDKIAQGITPLENEISTILMKFKMSDSSRKDFDVLF